MTNTSVDFVGAQPLSSFTFRTKGHCWAMHYLLCLLYSLSLPVLGKAPILPHCPRNDAVTRPRHISRQSFPPGLHKLTSQLQFNSCLHFEITVFLTITRDSVTTRMLAAGIDRRLSSTNARMAGPKLTLYVDTVSPFAYEAYYILRVSSQYAFPMSLSQFPVKVYFQIPSEREKPE
jgi:hypothetical protein